MTSARDERETRLNRIRQISGLMKWIVTGMIGVLIVVGIVLAFGLLFPGNLGFLADETVAIGSRELTIASIPLMQRMAVLLIASLIFGACLTAAWQVRQLFGRFRQADFFSTPTLSRMVSLGFWLLVIGVCDFLMDPISSLIITSHLPAGEKAIQVSMNGAEILFLVFGTLIILFGWIMREAASIAEENRQFV